MYCSKHTRLYRQLDDKVDMISMATEAMSHLNDADDIINIPDDELG